MMAKQCCRIMIEHYATSGQKAARGIIFVSLSQSLTRWGWAGKVDGISRPWIGIDHSHYIDRVIYTSEKGTDESDWGSAFCDSITGVCRRQADAIVVAKTFVRTGCLRQQARTLTTWWSAGVNISSNDISGSHRLPKSRTMMKGSPIIVKFVRRNMKTALMMIKKTLRIINRYRHIYINVDLNPLAKPNASHTPRRREACVEDRQQLQLHYRREQRRG